MNGGTVEVERIRSDGTIWDERAIDELLAELEWRLSVLVTAGSD